ncbi:rod-binding protein [Natranaerobius thermophilus]|uniref:Rod binding protein-like protein n=1 Tax=Natranaerobius thermophilus (strain ATCC BAA-1301 / DSM 18059 / JW/NM-WN-LF) TaxID=457570 RepID=B2A3F0_NATTJ|nr:rod-binding protein [Natranaerobius thermophilus]ACB86379.1 Rod binding protein-like protein [Natranaerobius thermophilus JW/NM-WN-LF]
MITEGIKFPSSQPELLDPGKKIEQNPEKFQQQLEDAQERIDSQNSVEGEQSQDANAQEKESQELYQAAQKFEGMFIQEMMKSMRETIPESDLIDGGFAEDVFESKLDQHYSEKMAESGGFGLADKIYEQFTSYQR